MRAKTPVVWLLLSMCCPVLSIPWYIAPLPAPFDRRGALIVMLGTPTPAYSDGDSVCARFNEIWWAEYEPLREKKKQIAADDSHFKKDFTHYPDGHPDNPTPDVPVESFMGESFLPTSIGWHENLWGCYVACQDIRKTLEWVLAMLLEDVKGRRVGIQARAKYTYAFECPRGMMSKTYTKISQREHDTQDEINEAIDLFYATIKDNPTAKRMKPLNIYGQLGPELTGCHCVEATEEEMYAEKVRRRLEHKRKKPYSEDDTPASIRDARVKSAALKRKKDLVKARNAHDAAESSISGAASHSGEQTNIDDTEQEIFGAILSEEIQIPSAVTCHDYNFPDIDVALPELPEPSIPLPESPDHLDEEDLGLLLRAFLDEFGGVSIPDFGSISDPKQKGHGP